MILAQHTNKWYVTALVRAVLRNESHFKGKPTAQTFRVCQLVLRYLSWGPRVPPTRVRTNLSPSKDPYCRDADKTLCPDPSPATTAWFELHTLPAAEYDRKFAISSAVTRIASARHNMGQSDSFVSMLMPIVVMQDSLPGMSMSQSPTTTPAQSRFFVVSLQYDVSRFPGFGDKSRNTHVESRRGHPIRGGAPRLISPRNWSASKR